MSNIFQSGDIVYLNSDEKRENPLTVKEYKYIPIGTRLVDTDDVVCIMKNKKGKLIEVVHNQYILTN